MVVVGGGNVAIDAARSALRLGAAAVHLVSLESRDEMPAYTWEVDEAVAEGVVLHNSWGVRRFTGTGDENTVAGTASPRHAMPDYDIHLASVALKRCTSVFDADGRFNPSYDEGSLDSLECEYAIVAVGMRPDTDAFASLLATNANKTIRADAGTLQTKVPYVFAAGDAVSGPTMITTAVGQGRRAAFMIDHWLQGRRSPLPSSSPACRWWIGPMCCHDNDSTAARIP